MAVWQKVSASNLSYGLRLDPEFYQPKYTQLCNDFKDISIPLKNIVDQLSTGKTPKYFEDSNTVPVIRSGDLDTFFLHEKTKGLLRTRIIYKGIDLKSGDILISAIGKGSIGKVSLYVGDGTATTVSEVVILKESKITPHLLAAYLSSTYGQLQIEQQITGSTGQLHLIRQYLENILIPNQLNIAEGIKRLYEHSFKKFNLAESLYPEAEQELLDRINWNKVKTSHILNYVSSSKNIFKNERFDPEFYQPKFENLVKHLKKIGSIKLGDFCPMPNRGSLIKYCENGDVLVINSSNLGNDGVINIENAHKTNKNELNLEANKDSIVNQYDLIFYAIGAYAGRTNCYLEKEKALAGNNVLVIKPDENICNPVYLALFLNSRVGLMLSEKYAAGSAQKFFHPQSLIKYPIFIPQNKIGKPDLEWQNKLADKVVQANQAKKEAKQKLQEAKELVEKEIKKMIQK